MVTNSASINKNYAYLYSKTSPLHYQLTQYNLTGWSTRTLEPKLKRNTRKNPNIYLNKFTTY